MLKDNNKVRITSSDSRSLILVISSLRGGGAERVMANIANYFVKVGVSVTLITFEATADDRYSLSPLVNRVHLPEFQSKIKLWKFYGFMRKLWCLRQALKRAEARVALSFLTETNVSLILMSFGLGIRCVVSERTDPQSHSLQLHWRLLRKLLYSHASSVVVQSLKIKKWMEQHTVDRAEVIPNMFDKQSFTFNALPLNNKNIVAMGRLSHEKGVDILIQAFALVCKKCPDWRLIILGDGPERSSLSRLALSLGLSDSIDFCGYVENPSHYLLQARFMVHVSRYEGFPNAVVEAMAHGLPVIASVAAGEMLIKHNTNGLLVPSESIVELSYAIIRLIEEPKLCNRLGLEATKIIELLDLDVIMKQWEKVLFDHYN